MLLPFIFLFVFQLHSSVKPVPFTPSCIFLATNASAQSLPCSPNSPPEPSTLTLHRNVLGCLFCLSRASPPRSQGLVEVYLVSLCSALTKEKEEGKALLPACCSVKNSRAGAPSLAESHFPEPHCCKYVTNDPFWHISEGSEAAKSLEEGGMLIAQLSSRLCMEFIFHPSDTSRVLSWVSRCDSPGGISAAGEMKLEHPDSLSPVLAGARGLAPQWLFIFIFNI